MLVVLLILLVLLLPFAIIGVRSFTQGGVVRRVESAAGPEMPLAVSDPEFQEAIALFTRTLLLHGHEIEVLTNGDGTFPRLWDDLRQATRSITIQVYYAKPGRIAEALRSILCERARAGVRVHVLYDAFGAKELAGNFFNALRQAGAHVAPLRPIRVRTIHKFQHRWHSRMVVVDGVIGYTGGFGIDDKWEGNGLQPEQWRDTNVRFTGPAVRQLQAAFAVGWAEATGVLPTGAELFPADLRDAEGTHTAGLLHTVPGIGSTNGYRFLILSIAGARERLYIANSYFAPPRILMDLLIRAACRGVDVRVLTASGNTDVKPVWWAGRARYEELLSAGVRIYEYQPAMMHAKTFVADGVWSTIGAVNLDNRSAALMDETSLMIMGEEVGSALEALFFADLQHSTEVVLEEFRRRPHRDRILEAAANLISPLL